MARVLLGDILSRAEVMICYRMDSCMAELENSKLENK